MLHDLPTKGGDFQYAGFYKSRFAESKAQRYGFREEKTVAEAKDLNHEGIATGHAVLLSLH